MQNQPQSPDQNGKPPAAPQTTALVPQPAAAATVTVEHGETVRVGFDTLQGFQALQRIGNAFASSSLVPEQYQRNVANCVIAIEMAARMGASPLMVMQNLYLIHGRPSWSSQFLIASFNNCGRFTPIQYRWSGEKNKPTWGCTAYAKDKKSGDLVEGPEVTLAMAKAEGWVDKKGSKWVTMPQLMLTYRAATFLVRTTAPDLTMGLHSVEEQEDIGGADAAPQPGGVEGLKALLAVKKIDITPPTEAAPAEPTDTPTSNDPDAAEQAAIRAREAEEAKR